MEVKMSFNDENLLHYASNGYDIVKEHLENMYGERGELAYNIKRYFQSDEFKCVCRRPNGIYEILEIPIEIIEKKLERDNKFQELAHDVAEKNAALRNGETHNTRDYYELAGVLGVYPGQVDWTGVLFPHLLDLWVSSEEEEKNVIVKADELAGTMKVVVNDLCDNLRRGQVMNYYGRDVWSQGYARTYFRGENAYNKKCKASCFRKELRTEEEKMFAKLVNLLNMADFGWALQELEYVQKWEMGQVYHGAVAQHYGVPTNAIDVTSNLKVALFFACCRWDKGKWAPLKNSDFEKADSREDVYKRGGDSRYGVIFYAPADIANMSKELNDEKLRVTHVTPIGYQPFLRPNYQSGYVIEASESYDMYKDESFAKVKFRHTEEFCKWIFDEMEQGQLIYPVDGFLGFEEITEKIVENKYYTKAAFEYALQCLNLGERKLAICDLLNAKGYLEVDKEMIYTAELIDGLNKSWKSNSNVKKMECAPINRTLCFALG